MILYIFSTLIAYSYFILLFRITIWLMARASSTQYFVNPINKKRSFYKQLISNNIKILPKQLFKIFVGLVIFGMIPLSEKLSIGDNTVRLLSISSKYSLVYIGLLLYILNQSRKNLCGILSIVSITSVILLTNLYDIGVLMTLKSTLLISENIRVFAYYDFIGFACLTMLIYRMVRMVINNVTIDNFVSLIVTVSLYNTIYFGGHKLPEYLSMLNSSNPMLAISLSLVAFTLKYFSILLFFTLAALIQKKDMKLEIDV